MPIASAKAFPCPNCGSPLNLSPALDGRRFRCRTCGSILSLAIEARPRGRRRGTMIVSLVSGDEPCPRCLAPLHLVPVLQGQQIRCRGCQSLLAVSVRPWGLSLESGENSSDAVDEPAVAPNPQTETGLREAGQPPVSGEMVSDVREEPLASPPETETANPSEPEAASETPLKPSISTTATAAPFNRHAMDEPRDHPHVVGIGLVGLALVALAAGAWWVRSGRPVHPEARYLPTTCERFISIRWSLLGRTGIDPTAAEAQGPIPLQRCRTFLKNAAIDPAEVERINVGVAADGEGTVLVYRLTHPIHPEALVESGSFRDPQKGHRPPQVVGGVTLYPLGRTSLAFPDSRTIVNGETELLEKALAGPRTAFPDSLNRLLGTLDFSAPVVIASVGVGEPVQSLLQKSGVKSEAISGTTDCLQPGPTVPLLCVLHLRDPRSAESVAGVLKQSLREVAQDAKTAEPLRRLLAGSRVWATDGKVQVQLTAQGDPAAVQPLALLKPLFY